MVGTQFNTSFPAYSGCKFSYLDQREKISLTDITEQRPMIRPGDIGKNFSLKDQNDKIFDILENSGKKDASIIPSLCVDSILCRTDGLA